MADINNQAEGPQAPPKGCVWKRADRLEAGDKCLTEDGRFRTIRMIDTAKWIKTADGYCVWIYWRGGGDEVAGKSAEFAVKA